MNRLKKERGTLRSSFTKTATSLKAELENEAKNFEEIQVLVIQLIDKFERLNEVQEKLLNHVLDDEESSEDAYKRHFDSGEEYRERYLSLKTRAETLLANQLAEKNRAPSVTDESERSVTGNRHS